MSQKFATCQDNFRQFYSKLRYDNLRQICDNLGHIMTFSVPSPSSHPLQKDFAGSTNCVPRRSGTWTSIRHCRTFFCILLLWFSGLSNDLPVTTAVIAFIRFSVAPNLCRGAASRSHAVDWLRTWISQGPPRTSFRPLHCTLLVSGQESVAHPSVRSLVQVQQQQLRTGQSLHRNSGRFWENFA